jgi:hypothetical protein
MQTHARAAWLSMLALGAMVTAAAGQSAMAYGIIGGVSVATMTGSDADGGYFVDSTGSSYGEKTSLVGFAGGVFLDIPAGNSLVFEPQVLYVQKGVGYANGFLGGLGSVDLSLKLNYINIPLLLRYNFRESATPYALAGAEVGFNVSCSVSGATSDGSASADCPSGTTKDPAFGGILGLGYQKQKIGLEMRYEFDFGGALKDFNAKNSVWLLLLRYSVK